MRRRLRCVILAFVAIIVLLMCVSTASASTTQDSAEPIDAPRAPHLLVISFPAAGHINPLLGIAKELVLEYGYRVTVASFDDVYSVTHLLDPQYFEFFSMGSCELKFEHFINESLKQSAEEFSLQGFEKLLWMMMQCHKKMYPTLFSKDNTTFQTLLADVDIVLYDIATTPMFDFSVYYSHIPCVSHNPSILIEGDASVPALMSGFSAFTTQRMNLWQRLVNQFYRYAFFVSTAKLVIGELGEMRARYGMPPMIDPYGNKCLRLTSTAFGFDYARTMTTLDHFIGPASINLRNPKPLAPALQKWLDGGSSGTDTRPVVLVVLGTSAQLMPWQAKELIQGLNSTQFRVLFVLRDHQHHVLPKKLPDNFHLESVIPQTTVLNHTNIKAFVSHCGMNSAQEGLYFGKPILGIPFLADQRDVAVRVMDAGAGLMVNKLNFTAQEIKSKIDRILNEPSFTKAAQKVSLIFKTAGGAARAAQLIDVTRRIGTDHLLPPSAKLPWYQAYSIDIYLVVFAILYVTYKACRRVLLLGFILCCKRTTAAQMPPAQYRSKSKNE